MPFRIVYPEGSGIDINTGGNIDFGDDKKWRITSIKSVKFQKTGTEVIGLCKERK